MKLPILWSAKAMTGEAMGWGTGRGMIMTHQCDLGHDMGPRAFASAACLAGALLLSGCGEAPAPSTLPGQVAVDVPGVPIKAYQGTVVMVGDCGVGIVRVASDYADVDTFAGGIGGEARSSQRWLREGQLVVACGALHRVQGFAFDDAGDGEGHSGRALLLDPVPAKGPRLQAGSVVLTLDGVVRAVGPAQVTLKNLSITMQSGRAMARFRFRGHDGDEASVVGGPGDLVEIAGARHSVVAVAPPDMAIGIPGWVELDGTPAPQ
jgi:hypothetical protein